MGLVQAEAAQKRHQQLLMPLRSLLGLKSDASKMLRFYKALSATKRTLVISPLEGKIKGIHNIRMPFIRF